MKSKKTTCMSLARAYIVKDSFKTISIHRGEENYLYEVLLKLAEELAMYHFHQCHHELQCIHSSQDGVTRI
jgi:hypothetical protein